MKEKVQYIPAPEAAKILGLAPQTLANQKIPRGWASISQVWPGHSLPACRCS